MKSSKKLTLLPTAEGVSAI